VFAWDFQSGGTRRKRYRSGMKRDGWWLFRGPTVSRAIAEMLDCVPFTARKSPADKEKVYSRIPHKNCVITEGDSRINSSLVLDFERKAE